MVTPTALDVSFRVVDLSEGIAGAYCTKILADAGADVIMIEPPSGSPLRRRSASGQATDPTYGGVLFQFLSSSKQSAVVDLESVESLRRIERLLSSSDAIVWSEESSLCRDSRLSVERLRALAPQATVLALSGYGLDGPWMGRPSNEFIWQSLSGSAWSHGSSDGTPIMIGGSHGDYSLGTLGALGILLARFRDGGSGRGELVEVAGLEVLQLTHNLFPITFVDTAGRPNRPFRTDPIPGIHRTKDGWVGLWVTTGQQWLDFCTMTERFDWLEDASLGLMDNRAARHDELLPAIDAWAAQRTTDEIVDFASLLRIPVAPIGTGRSLPTFDQFVERQQFVANPRSGFTQPDVWYQSSGAQRRPFEPSPGIGEHTNALTTEVGGAKPPMAPALIAAEGALPFEGLRIVDMTSFWAGPIISHVFAMLGADVIHVESVKRPDGIRMATTIPMSEPGWWEMSPFFNATNTCKRGLTLDLHSARGRELLQELIAMSDVVVENFSPRVMDQLGLTYERLTTIRPDIIMVRAPAFGTSGPWKDRVGYAPTIDQAGGLSWVTGEPDQAPQMVGAASDALGGLHGSLALLFALEHRRRTGVGALVESPQIGTALQFTAEQVAEYSANGILLERVGNRSWVHAPQGVYRSADRKGTFPGVADDDWLALTIERDEQWRALCSVVDGLSNDVHLDYEGRSAAHDRIDAAIAAWCQDQDAEAAATKLTTLGIPAARVVPPHELANIEPLTARAFYEIVEKPVAGSMRVPAFPVRLEHGPARWHRTPAPRLGEHNRAILEGIIGLTSDEVDALEAEQVIGYATSVNLGW